MGDSVQFRYGDAELGGTIVEMRTSEDPREDLLCIDTGNHRYWIESQPAPEPPPLEVVSDSVVNVQPNEVVIGWLESLLEGAKEGRVDGLALAGMKVLVYSPDMEPLTYIDAPDGHLEPGGSSVSRYASRSSCPRLTLSPALTSRLASWCLSATYSTTASLRCRS